MPVSWPSLLLLDASPRQTILYLVYTLLFLSVPLWLKRISSAALRFTAGHETQEVLGPAVVARGALVCVTGQQVLVHIAIVVAVDAGTA
jgi:hypothetical protein